MTPPRLIPPRFVWPAGTTLLAVLIAQQEGFGVPGAIPTVRNNPGDLRHSPHSAHPADDPNGIGTIDTVEHGWEDLERQLKLNASRGMNLQQCIFTWAPQSDGNDPGAYLRNVIDGFAARGHTAMGGDSLDFILTILA